MIARGCSTKDNKYHVECENHVMGKAERITETFCYCGFNLCNSGAVKPGEIYYILYKIYILLYQYIYKDLYNYKYFFSLNLVEFCPLLFGNQIFSSKILGKFISSNLNLGIECNFWDRRTNYSSGGNFEFCSDDDLLVSLVGWSWTLITLRMLL